MTRLRDALAPATMAELDSLAASLSVAPRGNGKHYAAPSRGGASLSDMCDEINLGAAMRGQSNYRGDIRYAWQRDSDNAGTFYRCRVTYWGRFDVNGTRRCLAASLTELWDSLAAREWLPRDVWSDDSAFLAFLLLGNVTPRHRDRSRDRSAFTGTAIPQRDALAIYPRRNLATVNGTLWQLVRVTREDGTVTRRYVPADPKHGDSIA